MRAFVTPQPHTLSRAMFRVSEALTRFPGEGVTVVGDPRQADLKVVHVIGYEGYEKGIVGDYAILQYCIKSAGGSKEKWEELWCQSKLVWSYYLLNAPHFYHAPLGVDGSKFWMRGIEERSGILTSGYVSGGCAEAIEEVADAALRVGIPVTHLGPECVSGMKRRRERTWTATSGITDDQLSVLYRRSKWVSGLRHVEGFELPVLEGLACGARPIVFDREEMRHWYGSHAVFIPECSGAELTERLCAILSRDPEPVSREERDEVIRKFDWEKIAAGFWRMLQ